MPEWSSAEERAMATSPIENVNDLVRRLAKGVVSGSAQDAVELDKLLTNQIAGPVVSRHLKGRQSQDLDDLLQEIRTIVVNNAHRLIDASVVPSPAGWIYSVSVNQIRLYFRKVRAQDRRQQRHRDLGQRTQEAVSATNSVDDEEEIARFIDGLPNAVAQQLLRMRLAGESWEAIRGQLGLSERDLRRLQDDIRQAAMRRYPERCKLITTKEMDGGDRHD